MKSKILFGSMLALLLVSQVSFAEDDDKKRLLEEYEKMQEAKANQQEVVNENGEVVTVTKKAEKDMTESERMDAEIQRIKRRMLEINSKIDNYNKTNEMINNLEKNVGDWLKIK